MCDDLLDAIVLQRFNVLLRQHLKEVLVAQTPSRITGTGFLLTQNGKAYLSLLQNSYQGLRDAYVPVDQRARAADPEKILGVRLLSQEGHREPCAPGGTGGLRATPRVPTLLQATQCRFRGFRHTSLFED